MAEISQNSGHGKKKIRSRKISTKIDMTPMVDLAFLLLTFFVMTTTLLKQGMIQLDVPEKPEEKDIRMPVLAYNLLTIILSKDNTVCRYMGVQDPKVT